MCWSNITWKQSTDTNCMFFILFCSSTIVNLQSTYCALLFSLWMRIFFFPFYLKYFHISKIRLFLKLPRRQHNNYIAKLHQNKTFLIHLFVVAKANIHLYMYPYPYFISTDLYLLQAEFHIRANTNTFPHPNCRVFARYYSIYLYKNSHSFW